MILRIIERIVLVAETLLIAAGHQAGTRRAAIGMGNVTLRAAQAFAGKAVEVWCGDVLAALETDIRITMVITDNEKDVRLFRRQGGEGDNAGYQNKTGWMEGFHNDDINMTDSPAEGNPGFHRLATFKTLER